MADHVTEWLGAYHDGELRGARLRQVEAHLAECAACQVELDEISNLSALLQDTAPIGDFLPTERFVANLLLTMPRQSVGTQSSNIIKIGWWLIPVGLLGAWLFIDITIWLRSMAMLAVDAGLLNGQLAWQQGGALQMTWFATVMNLFGNQLGAQGRMVLLAFNEVNLVVTKLAERILPQTILAAAYLGWLITWWLRHTQTQKTIRRV